MPRTRSIRVWACLLALALLAPGCRSLLDVAPARSMLASDPAVLPTKRCGDVFLAAATINGRGPFTLLVDTGAGVTAVSPAVAEELAAHLHPTRVYVAGATGRQTTVDRRLRIETLESGGVRLEDFDAIVLDLRGFDTALGGELDGVLGYPAFRDLLLRMDYPAGEVRLSAAGLDPGVPGTVRIGGGELPMVPLTIGDQTIRVVLDTGSTGELSLRSRERVEFEVEPRPAGATLALGGPQIRRVGRAAVDGSLAGVVLRRPMIEVGAGINLLGAGVLRNFVVNLDQRSGLARLEHAGTGPIEFDSVYGIGVATTPEDGSLRITDVFPGSPGERAGLRPGDRVLAIDGRTVIEVLCTREHIFPAAGAARLLIDRDGVRTEMLCEVVEIIP